MISNHDLRQIWTKSKQDQVLTQATALAYTTILSLVPVLAVAFFLFNAFGGFEALQDKIQPLIEENLAPSFSNQISQYLSGFLKNSHAGTVGIFGAIGFMITSISTLATIEKTFNLIWGVNKLRGLQRRVTTYWSLLTVGPMLLGVSLLLSSKAMVWLRQDNGAVSHALIFLFEFVPYLSVAVLFSALYMFMPNTYVNKKDALKAGFLTGFAFELAKLFYAFYATRAIAHNAVYGSLVIIPIFLVWLYVVWVIVLFGAELCCFFQNKRHGIPFNFGVEDRLNAFVIVDIVEVLGDHQEKPKGGMNMAELLNTLKVPLQQLLRHLDFLEEEGWVVMSQRKFRGSAKYHLSVPEEKVDVNKIFEQLEKRRYVPQSERGREVHTRFVKSWADWMLASEKKDPHAK